MNLYWIETALVEPQLDPAHRYFAKTIDGLYLTVTIHPETRQFRFFTPTDWIPIEVPKWIMAVPCDDIPTPEPTQADLAKTVVDQIVSDPNVDPAFKEGLVTKPRKKRGETKPKSVRI